MGRREAVSLVVTVVLSGCDDDTRFNMEMTEEEYMLLLKVSEKSLETATYGCMPVMLLNKDVK